MKKLWLHEYYGHLNSYTMILYLSMPLQGNSPIIGHSSKVENNLTDNISTIRTIFFSLEVFQQA